MRNILKIFWGDVKNLSRNFFALVIAIGLCILPALYAWFNIYANWNPYGNTGNIKIAVVNLDKGGENTEGEFVNMGANVVEELKGKNTIKWVFVDNKEAGVEGVKSGKYYAALVIDEKFTENMYEGIFNTSENPVITYYVNDKKNAVATKITDTAVSTLQTSINETYIRSVIEILLSKTSIIKDIAKDELENKGTINYFIECLTEVKEELDVYKTLINDFVEGNNSMNDSFDDLVSAINNGDSALTSSSLLLNQVNGELKETKEGFASFSNEVVETLDRIEASIDNIATEIENAKLDESVDELVSDVKQIQIDANGLSEDIMWLHDEIFKLYINNGGYVPSPEVSEKIQELQEKIQSSMGVMNKMQEISSLISIDITLPSAGEITKEIVDSIKTSLNSYSEMIGNVKTMYTNEAMPQVNDLLDTMTTAVSTVENLFGNITEMTPGLISVINNVNTTLDLLNANMEEVSSVIDIFSGKIDGLLEVLNSLSEDERLEFVAKMLSGETEGTEAFLSQPVQVEDHYIYEIENYGSGVTPFYTILAIWVGMTILVSLVKVHADEKKLKNAKPSELYLGRYALFFFLSQMQALIIVLGDLFILKIQCHHKLLFWLTAAVASFAFSLIVYTLTISFGDIGKALAVILMVIQIAGSGGTYPIEVLPDFFRNVYIFFPFPYAIDAMRECIGGMYGNKFLILILQLLLFCVASLVVGLVIRIPFIHFNHYIEKRMEDTEIL